MYNQYKDNCFEIVSLSLEDVTKKDWLAAIEKDKLPWVHITVK